MWLWISKTLRTATSWNRVDALTPEKVFAARWGNGIAGRGDEPLTPGIWKRQRTAGVFLDTLGELAYKEVKKNGEFVLPGFGKLVKQKRKARTGFNPKTQQKIKIPAKTVVKFRVAKAAKDAVLGVKK